jgi:hypothetical protein
VRCRGQVSFQFFNVGFSLPRVLYIHIVESFYLKNPRHVLRALPDPALSEAFAVGPARPQLVFHSIPPPAAAFAAALHSVLHAAGRRQSQWLILQRLKTSRCLSAVRSTIAQLLRGKREREREERKEGGEREGRKDQRPYF